MTSLLFLLTTTVCTAVTPDIQRQGRIFTFSTFLTVSDSIFIKQDEIKTDEGITTETALEERFTKGIQIINDTSDYSEGISKSALKKISNENGDFILVSTKTNVAAKDSGNDTVSSVNKMELQIGKQKLEYLGSIQKFGERPDSNEQSFTYIETHDFSPCTLEQKSNAKIKGAFDDLNAQGRQEFKANCFIGKRLSGEFFASVIVTDFEGEIVEEVELTGSLTLQVSKALTVKYGHSYLRGEDPLDVPVANQSTATGSPTTSTAIVGSGLRIGKVVFLEREQIQGRLHEFELEHTKTDGGGCTINKKFNLKIEDGSDEKIKDETLYKINLLRECDTGSSVEFSASNSFEQDKEKARVVSFAKSIESADEQAALRTKINVDVGKTDVSKEWFANYNITHRRVDLNGKGNESSFDVFYAENRDSYIVAKHIFIFPILESDKFRDYKKSLKKEKRSISLKDVDLCSKIDCENIGAAMTFKENGGIFVSAEGRTLVEAFGLEASLRLTAGLGLNSKAENEGFGANIFFNNDQEDFVQLRLETPGCDKLYGGCAALNVRKEEKSFRILFGGTVKF